MLLSIVSPCYGAPTLLKELARQLSAVASRITQDYEIILVEDASPDNSREIISEICKEDRHVKGVFLSRNFGQQPAINAGLDVSQGDWVAVIDCDLQNPPSSIYDMYQKALEGYDIVYASRQNRPDNYFMTQGSKLFNRMMSFLTGIKQDETVAEFVIYNRKVINAMKQMEDYVRYYPLMTQWVGFKSTSVQVAHNERTDGKESSYSIKKRIELGVTTSIAFSTKALHMIVYFGLSISLIAIILAIGLAVDFLMTGIDVSGWFTLFVSMWFVAGIMIMVMGIVAIYIGNIFMEVKHRPSYIISDILNEKQEG